MPTNATTPDSPSHLPSPDEEAGLVSGGEGAWYANSIGHLLYWIEHIILAASPQPKITKLLLMNFHLGMHVSGTFGKHDHLWSRSLTRPTKRHRKDFLSTLFGRLSSVTEASDVWIGTCSPATVAQQYVTYRSRSNARRNEKVADWMLHGYPEFDGKRSRDVDRQRFERAYNKRLQIAHEYIEDVGYLALLRSAMELPHTSLYIEFAAPLREVRYQRRGLETAIEK